MKNSHKGKTTLVLLFFAIMLMANTSLCGQSVPKLLTDARIQELGLEFSDSKFMAQKITLNFHQVSIKKLLKYLEQTKQVTFSYNNELLVDDPKITVSLVDVSLSEALDEIFAHLPVKYFPFKGGYIVLKHKQEMFRAIQEEISGTITDASTGESLPGVNVMLKGTTIGTSTDINGEYELTVESLQDTLVFSYVGYSTATVPINNRTSIDVELQPQTISGEEVVVVGYGEQTRESLTGSVSSIENEEIMKSPAVNVGNALTGKISGLQISQYSGQPGGDRPRIFMRGIGSLSTGRSNPLIIVDGVERDMFQLEPDNIESISVLKDAAATAVYGVRGANGVIVVETKRGKKGPIQVSTKFSAGFQQPTNLPEFVGSYRYAKLFNEAQIGDGVSPDNVRFSDEAVEAFRTNSNPLIYPNTDWIDYLTKPSAFQTRNSLSISGGTDAVKYFVSGGYLKQDGLFRTFNSDYDFNPSFTKYNFRTNLDVDATSTTRISLTGYGRIGTRIRTRGGAGNAGRWRQIYRGAPFAGSGIVDGKLVSKGFGSQSNRYISRNKQDPFLRLFGQGYNEHVKNVLNIDLGVRQKLNFITDGLSFKIKGSYNTIFTQNKYRDANPVYYTPYFKTDVDPTATSDSTVVFKKYGSENILGYSEDYGRDRKWYIETRLEYNQDFGRHSVGGLLLYNQRRNHYPSEPRGVPRGLVGMVGRANYSYDDRYFLEINMGYNGSENFAEDRRFGFFPSFSAGWILTNESFMENVSFLNHLKLRASYGLVGNDQGVGRFLYLPTVYEFCQGTRDCSGYNFGYDVPQNRPPVGEAAIGNPQVTWETAAKQNYGIDLRFLQDQLSVSFDYFYENRTDILTRLNTVPAYVDEAANLPAVNVGEVENKGYGAEIQWQQQVGNYFSYYVNANVSFARNEILEMDELQRNEPYLQRTGHPVGQPFGYIFDGFFTESDVKPDSNVPQHPFQPKPGDLKFKDLNGDDVVNAEDQRAIGYPITPEYTFGANIGFSYRNFDIVTVWSGATNVSRMLRYEPYRTGFGPGGQGWWSLLEWQADGRWTPEKGQDATFPRLSTTIGQRWNNMDSDLWLKDASYLRLKNIEIGYNVSPDFLNNLGLKNMRIYINGYNLLTFSKLKDINLDPETRNATPGAASYPIVKVYNFGINVDF